VDRVSDHAPAAHHDFLINCLELVERGKIRRLMIFMPPGSAKSTYASVLFPSWYMGRNPDKNLIAASYAQRLSSRFGKRCRNIVGSTDYKAIFGFGLAEGSAAKDEWEVASGGEYTATSVDGAVTGRRGDLIIIDDPVKGRAEADSETVRETTWNWYQDDLKTRLKPGGAIVLIQTRWHEDDLAGRLLPEEYSGESGEINGRDGEKWHVVCLKAQAEDGDPLGRNPCEWLWPEWFVPKELEQIKISQGERSWSALYQQRPSPEEGDYFKREWIRWYDTKPEHIRVYGASDYAVTDDGGDYTVHGVCGVDPNDDIYILDWWREQADSEKWIEAFIDLVKKWKPLEWEEESGQIIKGVGPFIKKRQRETQAYCYRRQLVSSTDKPTRAQAFRGRMAQGKVYFPRNAPWVQKLITEMMTFPAGRNDDQVDVLSLFGRMLAEMRPGQMPPPPEKPRTGMTFNELRDYAAKQRQEMEDY
jgi:predicted phage terminase large subunit-like protein